MSAPASFTAPQPLVRLELLRIFLPLAILGFMSSRIAHADDWLSTAGFAIPDLHGDWRQPFYLPPLAPPLAWGLGAVMAASGLALSFGASTRFAAGAFAATLLYVNFADRLASFTVTKLGAVLVVALFFTPCGSRWSVDAWLARRRDPSLPVYDRVGYGSVRFFQALLVVFYASSGISKWAGDWATDTPVIWSHLHDSYQTVVGYWLGRALPSWSWYAFQWITLLFEVAAPVWFALRWARPFALGWGVAMHAMIGLMFGPVVWFSLLMITLLVAGFAPVEWLERALDALPRLVRRWRAPGEGAPSSTGAG